MQYKQKWPQAQILQHALISIYTEIKFYFLTWLILQLSKDSPGLENEIIKFHFFQCLPGPVQTSGIYFSNKLSLLMYSTKFPVLHHTSLSGLWGSMRRYGCPALHSTTCESPNHAT